MMQRSGWQWRQFTRRLLAWLRSLRAGPTAAATASAERQRAVDLIAAIDAGGMPLHPGRVNAIARTLGLEVSPRAPIEETIGRIRAALSRA